MTQFITILDELDRPIFVGSSSETKLWLQNNLWSHSCCHIAVRHLTGTTLCTIPEYLMLFQEEEGKMTNEIVKTFVPKYFEMDPKTDILLSSGNCLQDGMVVLLESNENRIDLDAYADLLRNGSAKVLEECLRWNRWMTISMCHVTNNGVVDFIATYEDRTQKKIRVDCIRAWYVKIDSIPEIGDEENWAEVFKNCDREKMVAIIEKWEEVHGEELGDSRVFSEVPLEKSFPLVQEWAEVHGFETVRGALILDHDRKALADDRRARAILLRASGLDELAIAHDLGVTKERVRRLLSDPFAERATLDETRQDLPEIPPELHDKNPTRMFWAETLPDDKA
jgi:hypothetical protein